MHQRQFSACPGGNHSPQVEENLLKIDAECYLGADPDLLLRFFWPMGLSEFLGGRNRFG